MGGLPLDNVANIVDLGVKMGGLSLENVAPITGHDVHMRGLALENLAHKGPWCPHVRFAPR